MSREKHDFALTHRYDARRAFKRALVVLFGMLLFLLGFVLTSVDVLGQDRWTITPSRGGAEGARAQAQLTTIQNESMRMSTCTVAGRIYAPTHPNRDTNDCIPHLTLNPTTGIATFTNGLIVNSGGVTVNGNSTFQNTLNVTGATTFGNTLNVTGATTFGNNVAVSGRVTTNQLFVGSGNVGSIPTCTSAQKLQWNGTAWTCAIDNIGATAGTESDPKIGTLTIGRWCRTNGVQVHCDVNVPLVCGTGQKLNWDGSKWQCASDVGIITEEDPQVGALNAGKWCRANSGGNAIDCDRDPPRCTLEATYTSSTCGGGFSAPSCPSGYIGVSVSTSPCGQTNRGDEKYQQSRTCIRVNC